MDRMVGRKGFNRFPARQRLSDFSLARAKSKGHAQRIDLGRSAMTHIGQHNQQARAG
jgi:hypothetical protein